MNLGDLLDRLAKLPRDSSVYFNVDGAAPAKVVDFTVKQAESKPDTGCERCDDVDELNPDLFVPRVVLEAAAHEEANKLSGAVSALMREVPDRRRAIQVKQEAGLFLNLNELTESADPW